MPTLANIQAFEFSELNDEAKDKVRYWVNDDFVIETVSDTIENDLEYYGLEINAKSLTWDIDRAWSIAFDGEVKEEKALVCKAIVSALTDRQARCLLAWIDHGLMTLSVGIRSQRYGQDYGLKVELETDYNDPFPYNPHYAPEKLTGFEALLHKVEEYIEDYVKDIAEKALRNGREDYEYQFTDEAVKESCDANEYRFDCYGNPIHHLIG